MPAALGKLVEDVDQPPDEIEQSGFDQRRDAADDQHGEEGELRLADIMPDEAADAGGRLEIRGLPERIDPVLEPAIDGHHHSAASPLASASLAVASLAAGAGPSSTRKPPDWRCQSWA